MSRYPMPYSTPESRGEAVVESSVVISFMNQVYAWMCVGLVTTAILAWWAHSNNIFMTLSPGWMFGLIIAEFALVFIVAYALESISAVAATVLFLIYSAINGVTLSWVLAVYAQGTVVAAFAVTAGMFLAMSIIGYVTRRDLSSLGGILLMGLIGIILGSIVNAIFLQNQTMDWLITYAGVVIFMGLTAYDTQKLKTYAYATQGNPEAASRLAIVGSLDLYLDFINLFLFILKILGKNKN